MNEITKQSTKCKNPGNCRVILVEDDEVLALVLSSELQSAGIKFCAASDGIQALELIKSHKPSVLLLDIYMPLMNGFELIEVIRSSPDLEHLRAMSIIVHTSMDITPEEEARLTLDGKMEFITKLQATEDVAGFVSKFYSEN